MDSKKIALDVQTVGNIGKGDYLVRMSDASNIDYIVSLIRQSYDANFLKSNRVIYFLKYKNNKRRINSYN